MSSSLPDSESLLRRLPSLTGPFPEFDTDAAPADPVSLFCTWLQAAIDAQLTEPHAMTLSTVDADGAPSARVLILKAIDATGFQFATGADSPTGEQLQVNPAAALTFYWSHFGRQVRVRGRVRALPQAVGARDFLERSLEPRAIAVAGRQSSVLDDREEFDRAIAGAVSKLESQPEYVSPAWTRYLLEPAQIEFWQANPRRRHTRLRYRRDAGSWIRELLWP